MNDMKSPKGKDDLLTLKSCINSTKTLIASFELALRAPTSPPLMETPPQPLALLSDSCKILKAQTTKLSLLILNKPFTPTAITYILNDCTNGCIPAMMSALELCPPEAYTNLLHHHIKTSLVNVQLEFSNLIESIPQDEHGVDPQNRGILASTGVLWAECDELIQFSTEGLVPFVIRKAEEYHGLLKDAIAELDNWDPEEDDLDSDIGTVSPVKAPPTSSMTEMSPTLVSDFQNLSVSPIHELRKRSLTTLRTVRLLYPALQKRRIASFPNISKTTNSQAMPTFSMNRDLEAVMAFAKGFTEAADEVAGSLYEGDHSEIVRKLRSMQDEGISCASRMRKNWKGEEDGLSDWLNKWEVRLKEIGATET